MISEPSSNCKGAINGSNKSMKNPVDKAYIMLVHPISLKDKIQAKLKARTLYINEDIPSDSENVL